MLKKLLETYKVPLLASLTLSIVLVALKLEREPLAFAAIILGTLLGTFLLDLDYIIYAYFLEPEADFSKTLTAFLKHGDFVNAVSYIQYHKNEMTEKPLNSVIFQLVLAGGSILVVSSDANLFVRALILSAFLNSMYRLAEHYFAHKTDEWFWALKNKPTPPQTILFGAGLLLVFVYCLNLF